MTARATLADLRRQRAGERGDLPPPSAAGPAVALIYPNSYAVGMSSLGFQATLSLMRRQGLHVERAFSLGPPMSIESETPLASFDVLIATHSPELIHKRWDLTVELGSPRVEAEVETIP